MKRRLLASSLLCAILQLPCAARCQDESIVLVTKASVPSPQITKRDALAVFNVALKPGKLPNEIAPNQSEPYRLYDRADEAGIWRQEWRPVTDTRGHYFEPSYPARIVYTEHGHFESISQSQVDWKDVTTVIRDNFGGYEWLRLRGATSELLSILIGKSGNSAFAGPTAVAVAAVSDGGTITQKEGEILGALFTLCPNLRTQFDSGSSGFGRVYFIRGVDCRREICNFPLGISLNDRFIGVLEDENTYLDIDLPAGAYSVGYGGKFGLAQSDYLESLLASPASRFKAALSFTLSPGETRYIRVRIHPHIGLPPSISGEMSLEDAQSASEFLGKPR